MRLKVYFLLLFTAFFLINGCGFHLRGACEIPCELKFLSLDPNDPSDPLQRVIRQVFKANGVLIVEPESKCGNILRITQPNFTERGVAYGPSNQVDRATLQLTFTYEVMDQNCNVLVPCNTIDVERDFTVNTDNAILGTENERLYVKAELYNDAALLLIRQLSNTKICPVESCQVNNAPKTAVTPVTQECRECRKVID